MKWATSDDCPCCEACGESRDVSAVGAFVGGILAGMRLRPCEIPAVCCEKHGPMVLDCLAFVARNESGGGS